MKVTTTEWNQVGGKDPLNVQYLKLVGFSSLAYCTKLFMIRLIKGEIESPWIRPFSTAVHLVQKLFVIINKRKSLDSNLTVQLISSGKVW